MADVTYEALQERVARKLQILATAETLDANDAVVIIDGIKSLQAQMSRLGLPELNVEGGIDFAYVDSFADMCAAELINDFQILEPLKGQIYATGKFGLPAKSQAERQFRDLLDGVTVKLVCSDPGITIV